MPTLRPEDDARLVEILGRQFFLGRASAYQPVRFGVIHGKALREELTGLPGSDRLRRARLLRLLGEKKAAARELAAVLRRRDAPAAAHAYRWESGEGGPESLDRAVALEPENGAWRLWRAIEFFYRAQFDDAQRDASAAAGLMPGNAMPLFISGLIWQKQRRNDRALPVLDSALALEPAAEWAHRLRAISRFEVGDLDGCLEDCFAAMRLDEGVGTLFIPLGLYRRQLAAREHVEAATKFIEKRPKAFWAYVYRADYRRMPEINENSSALADLKRAVELEPGCAWAWAYLTRCQTTVGDFSGANASIEKAVALDPGSGWLWAWRGEQLRRAGDVNGAGEAFDRAIALSPDYELAYAWRGAVRRAQGRPAEAVDDLDIGLRLEPTTTAWCRHERMHAFRQLGRYREALQDLDAAWRLNQKFVWENDPKRLAAAYAELDRALRKSPNDAAALAWQGDLLMRQRDFPAALKRLTLAVRADPRSVNARLLRGRVLGELGRWKKAHLDFDAAVRLEPAFPFARAWRGRARMVQGDLKGALADFGAALRREHNSAWILSWKGEAQFRRGRWALANADLTKALEVHARFGEAHLWRGAARFRLGRLLDADADLTEALRLQPHLSRARFYRGLVRGECGRAIEACEDLKAALASRDLEPADAAEARRKMKTLQEEGPRAPRPEIEAVQLTKEGRHEAAAEVYTRLLAAAPKNVEILRKRADCYRCMGRYDLALADRLAVVRLEPGEAGHLAESGETRRHLSDFGGALRDARRALALDPRNPMAWVLRSECERGLGRYPAAIRSAARASSCDPRWSWPHVVRAKALRQQGSLDEAIEATRRAEDLDGAGYALAWRGEILRKAGRTRDAFDALSKASALQPTNAWLLALLGETRRELGDPAGGLADIQKAMRFDNHCSCAYDFLGAEPPGVRRDASLAWVYAWRGGIHRGAGRLKEARSDLSRAVRLAPGNFWIVAWRGEMRLHDGDAAGALKDLDTALKLFPHYPQGLLWKGQALLKAGDARRGQRCFAAALALDPNDVWAMIGQAASLERLGSKAKARNVLTRAREIAPALFA